MFRKGGSAGEGITSGLRQGYATNENNIVQQNDLSKKNSGLWQKEQIRLQHDKLMQQRKSNDDKEEKES